MDGDHIAVVVETKIAPNSTQNSLAPLLRGYPNTAASPDTPDSDDSRTEQPKSKCSVVQFIRSKLLVILSIVGIVLGFTIGFVARLYDPSDDVIMWIEFPGDHFLSMLKMTILPLIISSVITSTASMDPKQNGKIGGLQVTYLVLTNLLGAIMGLILGVTIKPGSHMSDISNATTADTGLKTQDIFADLIRNVFPDNVVRATIQKKMTSYESVTMEQDVNGTIETVEELKRKVVFANSTNVLGLICVCAIFGIAAGQAKEKGKPFLSFFRSASEIVLIVIGWFLWVSPLGICSLIAASISSISDLSATFARLGLFLAAVSVGIIAHQLIIMPLIHFISVRTNPFRVIAKSIKAWFIGFASTSSAGAMPYMYEIADYFGVDNRVSSFCIPIGVTLNADGSALFICTSVLFLSQMHGIILDISQIAVVGTLTTISTLALPSVPSSSLVVIVIICTALSIPATSIGLLFTVEWLLDRLRTTSNVMTEIYAFLFVWHMTKDEILDSDRKAAPEEYDDDVPELKFSPIRGRSTSNDVLKWHIGGDDSIAGDSQRGSQLTVYTHDFHGA